MTPSPRWLPLTGAVNARDLGGLPTDSGTEVGPHRLLRSDNLQGLTPEDVRLLVDELGLRTVIDLRTNVEVALEGPGPLTREPGVTIRHLSLFAESGGLTDVDADADLPWAGRPPMIAPDPDHPDGAAPGPDGRGPADRAGGAAPGATGPEPRDRAGADAPGAGEPGSDGDGAAASRASGPTVADALVTGGPGDGSLPPDQVGRSVAFYLAYLRDRPDSVVAALRAIAGSDGAVLVHCAAGKDRTGVVVALALAVAGVPRDRIVADYAATADRLPALMARLRASDTYRDDLNSRPDDAHRPKPETMERFLDHLDRHHGGPVGWLTAAGFGADDAERLRSWLAGSAVTVQE